MNGENGGIHKDKLRVARELVSIGGWAALALFFMGQMSGYIPSVYADKLSEHDGRTIAMRESLEAHRMRQERLINTLAVALRVMCENTARTSGELNNCRNIQ